MQPRPGAPHHVTDFGGLPSRVQDDLRRVRDSYPRLEAHLMRLLAMDSLSPQALADAVAALFRAHGQYVDPRLVRFIAEGVPVYVAQAERLLNGVARQTISAEAQAFLLQQLRTQMLGPDAEASVRLANAIRAGTRGDALRSLAYGFQRADGSLISIGAAGQARVRTAVNAMQSEAQLARYREAPDVNRVQFIAGGHCTYQGEGGTCTGLDGTVFPLDAIPEWAQIPRHPYSNSRWVPYVELAGVDTGGPAAKEPPI